MARKNRRPMVQKSTATFLLIIGLVIGASLVSVWCYLNASTVVRETEMRVNAERDSAELEASKRVTGIVSQIGEERLLLVSANRGLDISFNEDTQIYRITRDATGTEQKEPATLDMITVGARITVHANQPIISDQSIYATDISLD